MKKKFVCIISLVFTIFSTFYGVGFCEGRIDDAVSEIIAIAQNKDGTVTLTDVRKNASGVVQTYSKAEIEDILFIVNDYYAGDFADENYYKDLCSNISDTDVESVISGLTSTHGPDPITVPVEMIIIIAGAVLVMVAGVILLIVLLKKNRGGNKVRNSPQRNPDPMPISNTNNNTHDNADSTEAPIPKPESTSNENSWGDDYF